MLPLGVAVRCGLPPQIRFRAGATMLTGTSQRQCDGPTTRSYRTMAHSTARSTGFQGSKPTQSPSKLVEMSSKRSSRSGSCCVSRDSSTYQWPTATDYASVRLPYGTCRADFRPRSDFIQQSVEFVHAQSEIPDDPPQKRTHDDLRAVIRDHNDAAIGVPKGVMTSFATSPIESGCLGDATKLAKAGQSKTTQAGTSILQVPTNVGAGSSGSAVSK
jgi:hypothetical protein